eukprot:TRINITY_DN5952_c0_g1_i6.p1 TRINITY_DN5952_c0_g1~~TRINITY_DN5952_c0_g1_i6.p1  ORF type:complete len:452 (+),score=124.87 TRINITY_DN5952_c0_g1_i6:25-1356(+)
MAEVKSVDDRKNAKPAEEEGDVRGSKFKKEIIVTPASDAHSGLPWGRLRILLSKLFFGSPTRMYQKYLEGRFATAGLLSMEIDVDFDTTMQCYVQQRVPKARTETLPLVMLHGFGSSATMQWEGQIAQLQQYFFLVIPNLVFFGKSITRASDRRMQFQAESVLKLLDHLQIPRFDLLGFSYGAAIAHIIAAGHPRRVRRVVLADEGIMMTRADMAKMQEELGIDDGHGFWKLPSTPQDVRQLEAIAYKNPMALPDFIFADIVNVMFRVNNRPEWERLIHHYTVDRPDDPCQNSKLLQDVLLIWGESDPMAPLRFGLELQEHLGELCQLAVIKSAKHMAHAQYPSEFNHLVADFLLSEDASIHGGRHCVVRLLERGDALISRAGSRTMDVKGEGCMRERERDIDAWLMEDVARQIHHLQPQQQHHEHDKDMNKQQHQRKALPLS